MDNLEVVAEAGVISPETRSVLESRAVVIFMRVEMNASKGLKQRPHDYRIDDVREVMDYFTVK